MFSNFPIIYRVGIVLAGCLFIFGGWLMYYIESNRFASYKEDVAKAAIQQEVKTNQIQKDQQLVNQFTKDTYAKDLATIRNSYKRLRDQSISAVSGISYATRGTDAASANAIPSSAELAEQCAETTGQLNALQGWIKNQQQVNK